MTDLKHASLAFFSAIGLLLSGCAGSDGMSGDASKSCAGAQIKVAQSAPSLLYLPYYVAKDAGYFNELQIDASEIDLGGTNPVTAAAVSGSVDVAIASFGSLAKARSEGAPLKVFAAVTTEYGSNVIVKRDVLAQRGVTAESPVEDKIAALRGMRIAVTAPGSGTDQLVRYLSEYGNMDPDRDLTIMPMGNAAAMISAFVSDRVDAFANSSPEGDVGAQQGDGEMFFQFGRGDFPPFSGALYEAAFAGERTIRSKPEVIRCFTAVLDKALKLISDDPVQAKQLVRQRFSKISDDIYNEAFDASLNSYPKTPVVDQKSAEKALQVSADVTDTQYAPSLLDDLLYEPPDQSR